MDGLVQTPMDFLLPDTIRAFLDLHSGSFEKTNRSDSFLNSNNSLSTIHFGATMSALVSLPGKDPTFL